MTPTPVDVAPSKFEGKLDVEFVPMDIEDSIADQKIENGREARTRNVEWTVRNIAQGRPKNHKVQQETMQKCMDAVVMVSLWDLACLSPNV